MLIVSGTAEAQLRVVTYNIAQTLGDEEALQTVIEELHADDKPGFDVPVSLFVFQEVRTMDLPVLASIINAAAPPGVSYIQGTYSQTNQDNVAGAQAMFYRAGYLVENPSEFANLNTGAGRRTNRWQLRLSGYSSADARFYIYSSHLKAETGTANQQQRLAGVQTIRADADSFPEGTAIIYAGDMNFYNNNEPGYLFFLTPGPGQANDPLGTGNWTGPGNAIKHSQSPRKIMAGGLIGGGMNQRFDFQLSTDAFNDGKGYSLMPDTYRSFGNDGMKFNDAINDGNNFYYPDNVPLSNLIANALHDGSDHIPVVAEYQIPARMNANLVPSNFGTVIQGASITAEWQVLNTAPQVVVPEGADTLIFFVNGAGVLSGNVPGQAKALDPPTTGQMNINTNTVGPASGTATFTSNNTGVQNPVITRTIAGNVLAPSQPSFAADEVFTNTTIEFTFDADSGTQSFNVPIWNVGFDEWQALLNVDGVDTLDSPFDVVVDSGLDIGDAPFDLVFEINTDGLDAGLYTADYFVLTSDEDLPGAMTDELMLTINVMIDGEDPKDSPCVGDLTGDGQVNVFDLLELLGQWGACDDPEDCPADLTEDGQVNVFDLLELLGNWGVCPDRS
ncbi:MAG: hypothetical protein EA377_09780 [Phycisphaerales bacterium]|nr:MAG: hypothetical protein EA377_09780 [Phycisphaerales bacterium]